MSRSIRGGGLLTKDPDSTITLVFDWDTDGLEDAVEITEATVFRTLSSGASTGLMAVSDVSLTGGNRQVQFVLTGGTLGQKYDVTCRVTTSEILPQIDDESFRVLIEHY